MVAVVGASRDDDGGGGYRDGSGLVVKMTLKMKMKIKI